MNHRTLTLWGIVIGLLGINPAGVLGAAPQALYAEPVGDNVLYRVYDTIDLALVMNNGEDRVGARAKLCNEYSEAPCDRIMFVFPQLRLDKKNNRIYWGDAAVAKFHPWGMRVTLDKGYRLKSKEMSKPVDKGFNRTQEKFLQVYLENNS